MPLSHILCFLKISGITRRNHVYCSEHRERLTHSLLLTITCFNDCLVWRLKITRVRADKKEEHTWTNENNCSVWRCNLNITTWHKNLRLRYVLVVWGLYLFYTKLSIIPFMAWYGPSTSIAELCERTKDSNVKLDALKWFNGEIPLLKFMKS